MQKKNIVFLNFCVNMHVIILILYINIYDLKKNVISIIIRVI